MKEATKQGNVPVSGRKGMIPLVITDADVVSGGVAELAEIFHRAKRGIATTVGMVVVKRIPAKAITEFV